MTNLTQQLNYQNQQLNCESVNLEQLAATIDGPFYCYSQAAIINNIKQCQQAFSDPRFHIHYAMKANSNLSILQLISEQGIAVDIVSIGEMQRALLAGFAANNIVYSGVGKTAQELQQAIDAGIGQVNIESAEELALLIELTNGRTQAVNAMIRVNPEVNIDTHAHITTGARGNKFGVALMQVREMLQAAQNSQVNVIGLAMHIGSQIHQTSPYLAAIDKLLTHITQLRAQGFALPNIDLGGGFGVSYGQDESLSFANFAQAISQKLSHSTGYISIQPDRSIVADAGILVSNITYIKRSTDRDFVILDTAMNDLMRPALYQANHPLITVMDNRYVKLKSYDVVGPICESSDTFEKKAQLPENLQMNQLVCFLYCGAYCAALSNSYNSRAVIAEVLVNKECATLIRETITQQALLKFEQTPKKLL